MKTILFTALMMAFIPARAQYQSLFGKDSAAWSVAYSFQANPFNVLNKQGGMFLKTRNDTFAFGKF